MRKKINFLLSMILIFGLTSCNSNNKDSTYTFVPDESNAIIYDGYYKMLEQRYTTYDLSPQLNWHTSKTTGDQKILVIPVSLDNYLNFSDTEINRLNSTFFLNEKSTDLKFSVSQYYNLSSYGQLNITGEVTNALCTYIENMNRLSQEQLISKIVDECYKKNIITKELAQEYDLDKDGYIDNIAFIYNWAPDPENDLLWAWSSSNKSEANLEFPQVNSYMWASIDFMYANNEYTNSNINALCYIHEVGHLLGLDDYYCYDEPVWDPIGKNDMQSYNLGDHNAYSKFALGWLKPYVVTDDCQIKLKTSSLYPEAILIKKNYNGSPFDEYILIEYYTPLNINSLFYQWDNPQYNGLKIYHVDSRLIQLNKTIFDNIFIKDNYTDYITNDGNLSVIGASNSPSKSFLQKNRSSYKLIHLLDFSLKNSYYHNYSDRQVVTNHLITERKKCDPAFFKAFFPNQETFNDGEELNFTVEVSNLNDTDCIVNISFN